MWTAFVFLSLLLQASMTVKDVLQSLVDDNMVDCERVGTSNYYWAFPSKALHARKCKLEELQKQVWCAMKQQKKGLLNDSTIEDFDRVKPRLCFQLDDSARCSYSKWGQHGPGNVSGYRKWSEKGEVNTNELLSLSETTPKKTHF